MDVVLQVEGLRRSFGDLTAVDGVSLHIGVGETYGLLGPNGAGKTTSISMIAGLLEPDAGTITIDGQPMTTSATSTKESLGLVPQDLAVYPDLTARENLRFFAKLYGISEDIKTRVDEVLEIIELTDRADDLAKEYSGGMKRRLNIGIGLLHRPRLLILDEPTVGVDPQSRNAILSSVEHLGEAGMAVLYTTHYMEEAERLCDRVGIIDEGTVIAEGTRRELVALVGQRDLVHLNGSGDLAAAVIALESLDGVDKATATDHHLEIVVADARQQLPGLLATASTAGASIDGVEVVEPDLEAVFLKLTGKALRE
ncbi:MAG: ABC transporter ATP-binding protein [Acidimicrobiia bacterium]|nr:ABC transporter ATP-binding protein [Acidimicrobiia bacterium]